MLVIKKTSLFVWLCLAFLQFSHAQSKNGPIQVNSSIWGLRITEGPQRIKLATAVERMSSVPQAYDVMRSARSTHRSAQWLGFIGGAGMGYYVVSEITADKDRFGNRIGSNTVPAIAGGAGLGLAVLSTTMGIHAKRKMEHAASIYNGTLAGADARPYSIGMGLHADGVRLAMRF